VTNRPGHPKEWVIGRYAIYDEIASGGMATVHLGRLLGPEGFGRTVAIKRMHPQFAKDPDFAAMFLDEARVATRVQHANVVSTLDIVALEGELFLVMEYVQGESFARLLRAMRQNQEMIQPKIAAGIMTGILYGLHAAHEAQSEQGKPLGIVHRDVSPQNVMVGADGIARVLDFGVARAAGRAQTTRQGQLKGKLAYMSPEQIIGDEVDRRTDVYAASVVLWEALAGQRLFNGDNEAVLIHKISAGATLPPSWAAGPLPERLDAVVMCGLSVDRNQRFATAWEMAAALEDAVGLASPRHIAAWVDRFASGTLARRIERVKEIESVSSNNARASAILDEPTRPESPFRGPLPGEEGARGASGMSHPGFDSGASAPGQASVSQVSRVAMTTTEAPPLEQGRGRRTFLVVGIVAGILGGLLGLLWLVDRGDDARTASASAAAASASAAVAASASASAAAAASAFAAASASAAAASASAAAAASALAAASASAQASAAAVTAHPLKGHLPDQDRCNPPFTIDSRGIRRVKPECM
jgi:eukaryotic-like serine/threonine-protein kinase